MEIKRTNSEDLNFISLVKDLDFYLALKDGEEHAYYAEFNKITALQNCLVLFENNEAVACGAIKPFDENTAEVKRMFVKPEFRGKGFASKILSELENWAKELGFTKTILETGKRQTEAVNLYSKTYNIIPSYGQYKNMENSICFEKNL
ncbi:GNAT family N-acetyltransferase [Halpernia frigidisoli]|uniref:Acetyltransferase (GNAT) family protein n=1 Tax=Halpernia frigidisoli TaxID=1125876 RepID=A0A1I3GZA8_9FLAO|nr:GNAT family N-acetyltransferase [Halpernia frigidisoli]SFI28918.1 Acetyltransferase (GNAT) family protein [Halpernia frigidisoli]